MGCGSSIQNMNEINTSNNNKCLAGKFNRTEIPKQLWLSRMKIFIADHIKQYKNYSFQDIQIIYQRLRAYEQSTNMLKDKNKHSQAVKILSGIFNVYPHLSPKQIREELTTMAVDYCINNKEHEFEEIAFVFSIIVNSPMIRFFETKY